MYPSTIDPLVTLIRLRRLIKQSRVINKIRCRGTLSPIGSDLSIADAAVNFTHITAPHLCAPTKEMRTAGFQKWVA